MGSDLAPAAAVFKLRRFRKHPKKLLVQRHKQISGESQGKSKKKRGKCLIFIFVFAFYLF